VFKKNDNKDNNSNDIQLSLLRTIHNNYELSLIKSILEDNNIPYIVKDYGVGGYMRIYTGTSFERTDILVEKSSLEEAEKLIESIILNEED